MIYPLETSTRKTRYGLFECSSCGKEIKTSIDIAKKKKTTFCRRCACKSKPPTRGTLEEKIQKFENNFDNPKEYLYDLYYNKKISINKIGIKFKMSNRTIRKILEHYNIQIKDGSKAVKDQWVDNEKRKRELATFNSNNLKGRISPHRLSLKEIGERVKNNDFILLKELKRRKTQYFKCKCKKCGSILKLTPYGVSVPHKCKTSKKSVLEDKTIAFLEKHNIEFLNEYSFKDLVFKKRLRFDFAIFKDEELFCLIECDGKQHFYKDTPWYSDELKIRDKMKDNYCADKNIKLIRIPFFHIGRVDDILEYHLKSLL